jgi:hypothetical protein
MGPRNRHHSGMGVRQAPREELQEPEDKRGVVLRYRVAEESHLVQESGRCDLGPSPHSTTGRALCTQILRPGLSPDAAYVVLLAWLVAASTVATGSAPVGGGSDGRVRSRDAVHPCAAIR